MILDKENEFCDATALSTAGTGLALVGDVMDLGLAGQDLGQRPIYLVIQVDTSVAASGGASSVQFQLVSDAQAALAADGTETLHVQTEAIPKATLVAGYQRVLPLPMEGPVYERYLGIQQNVSTNAVTAGKINAFLTFDPQVSKAHPDAL